MKHEEKFGKFANGPWRVGEKFRCIGFVPDTLCSIMTIESSYRGALDVAVDDLCNVKIMKAGMIVPLKDVGMCNIFDQTFIMSHERTEFTELGETGRTWILQNPVFTIDE
jgi:hypothetical protein